MLLEPRHDYRAAELEERVRSASTVTPALMSDIIAEASVSFAVRGHARARLNRLIDDGAWIDAALALVHFELPQWEIRRLLYEDGEWHCRLSKQPRLPLGLDDCTEGSHELLPLAILISFLQARRAGAASANASRPAPRIRGFSDHALCCENFA